MRLASLTFDPPRLKDFENVSFIIFAGVQWYLVALPQGHRVAHHPCFTGRLLNSHDFFKLLAESKLHFIKIMINRCVCVCVCVQCVCVRGLRYLRICVIVENQDDK